MRKVIDFFEKELVRIIIGASLFASALILDYFSLRYVALGFYIAALVLAGLPVFYSAVRGILRLDLLDEKFLMSIASIGAMILGEWSEGVAVMLFYLVGEYFEHKAVAKSRKSIKSLMDICPDTANVLVGGEECETDAEDVEPASLIVIRSGERVPIDCVVTEGFSDVDTSALTGESIPRSISPGDEIKSGSVLVMGVVTARTLRAAEESAAARVLALVENANEAKSKEENFITKFSRFYTPIVVGLAVLRAVIPALFKLEAWGEAIHAALTFLVISCPCALVISVPMAFFGGIGCAASRGILFKGGNVFAPLARAKSFAFDKTGTLTTGEFTVGEIEEISAEREEILRLAAIAEYSSNHPISMAVKHAYPTDEKPAECREMAGKGVYAVINGREVLVGNKALMTEFSIDVSAYSSGIYVAENSRLIGTIAISDKLKPEASSALSDLRSLGAERLLMLSGDKRENAERIGNELKLDEVYSELLPEEKYQKLESLMENSEGSLVYVGDGINDAPSLARADVGVSMGSIGSDSAIESSDLVLMSDKLDNLPTAIRISRKTLAIAKENIVFALGVKIAIMILNTFFGIDSMWLAVFADVGVAVLAILNSMRALRAPKL